MNDRIRELRKQIEAEEKIILNCNHDFGKPFYNAEMVKEPYGYIKFVRGSDVWHEPSGYRDVEKDRWSRKCVKCGFEEHTYNLKPIISGHEPSF